MKMTLHLEEIASTFEGTAVVFKGKESRQVYPVAVTVEIPLARFESAVPKKIEVEVEIPE